MSTKDKGIPPVIQKTVSLAGLVAAAPVLGATAAVIRATSNGPALFRQQRMGKDGRPFTLYKFRTMAESNHGPGVTAGGDKRITKIGKLLRKTKLDELPELWNVVKGDMALVGPRPEVLDYVELDDPLWKAALQVRPGITHPVTINLRNEEELLAEAKGKTDDFYREMLLPYKLKGYIEYAQSQTWTGDLKTLVKTAVVVLVPTLAKNPSLEDLEDAKQPSQEKIEKS